MVVYFLLFLLFLFFSLIYMHLSAASAASHVFLERNMTKFFFLPFASLVLLMGFRHEVGTDYWGYLSIYERFEAGDLFVVERFELGFVLVMEGVSALGLSGNFLLFLLYALTMTLYWAAIRCAGYESASMVAISIMLFLGVGPFFSATNTVRQDLAVSAVLFLYSLFYNKRVVSSVLSSFIGWLFHYSALTAFFIAFVPKRVLGFKFWFFVSLFCVAFSSSIFGVFFELLEKNYLALDGFGVYFESDGALREASGLGIRLVFDIVFFLFLSCFVGRINPKGVWFFNVAFFGLLLVYIFREYAMFLRIAAYFSVFKIIAIPWFLSAFKKEREKLLFFVFIVFYSLSTFARSATADQFIPYKFIFFY